MIIVSLLPSPASSVQCTWWLYIVVCLALQRTRSKTVHHHAIHDKFEHARHLKLAFVAVSQLPFVLSGLTIASS